MNEQKQVEILAHKECANYIKLDNGVHWCAYDDRPCYVINPRWPNIHDDAIDCDYFLEAVLPLDKELHKAVFDELMRVEYASRITDEAPPPTIAKKHCALCGRPFTPKSNRQRYCPTCGKANQKHQDAARQRRAYNKDKNLTVQTF